MSYLKWFLFAIGLLLCGVSLHLGSNDKLWGRAEPKKMPSRLPTRLLLIGIALVYLAIAIHVWTKGFESVS